MKIFREEIYKLFARFQKGTPFAFAKYCDGEWAAMINEPLDNNEFRNDTAVPQFYRDKLIEAFRWQHPDYYVGVGCPCCLGERAKLMRDFCGQPEDHMTFANIFVNTNYPIYKETFLKEYAKYDVHLVANKRSKIEQLPFKVEQFYPVGFSAWVNDYPLIEQIKEKNLKGKLFLFCAGPFGDILAQQLFAHNPHNIYLDIGSTLNPWLQSEGFQREYYIGGFFSRRTCVW